MRKPSSPPRRPPASGPKTARQQELNTKRRGELSELAFAYKAASEGFGVAKPYGDSERFDFILHQPQLARRRKTLARADQMHRQPH